MLPNVTYAHAPVRVRAADSIIPNSVRCNEYSLLLDVFFGIIEQMGEANMAKATVYEKYYEDGILWLTKKRKKGIFSFFFSRFWILFLLMVLQIVVFVSFLDWLEDFKPAFRVIIGLFMIAMLVYLFASDIDASSKLTWLFFIAIIPIPSSIFLFYTRMGFGHRRIKERVEALTAETLHSIPQDPAVTAALADADGGVDALVRCIGHSGCFPAYEGEETVYFPTGEAFFEEVLTEIAKAEKFIFLESYIIGEGYMWGKVLEILMQKAAAGVDVRVMYDGMCGVSILPMDYDARLRSFGIRAKEFAPIRPIVSSRYNFRDHRKILIVDGRTAFTGGINFADEYINRIERFGVWKDAGLMVRGEAVRSFTLMFLQMWNIDEETPVWKPFVSAPGAENASAAARNGFVIPYADCPMDDYKVGETVYVDILNRAKHYVYIMTPYLVLDGETEGALKYAAQRGVDVRLILPGIPDKKYAYALAKSYYRVLLDAGVKIYEYTPGFVHAKVFLCDDERAVVGSVNLDYRSLYHNYECATYLYRVAEAIGGVREDFTKTMGECREVTHETIKKEKKGFVFLGFLMRFIAPLI